MNKIILALVILSLGAGGFFSARHSTVQFQRATNASREAWRYERQLLSVAQNNQADLVERIRELKAGLKQMEAAATENPLWSVLETNGSGGLAPDLREHLFEELDLNWKSSKEFVVMSKASLREIRLPGISGNGKLTDIAATVLAVTPAEFDGIATATDRVQKDFDEWARAHTERTGPKDNVLAQYTVAGASALSISNHFVAELFQAVGNGRADLILSSSPNWMHHPAIQGKPVIVTIKRYAAAPDEELKVRIQGSGNSAWSEGNLSSTTFPAALLPTFPNGWAEVAEREGFELPKNAAQK